MNDRRESLIQHFVDMGHERSDAEVMADDDSLLPGTPEWQLWDGK